MSVLKTSTNGVHLSLLEMCFIIFGLFPIYLLPSVSIGSTVVLGILLLYSLYLAAFDKTFLPLLFKVVFLVFLIAFFYTLLTDTQSISLSSSNFKLKQFISKFYQYFTLYFPAILLVRVNKRASASQKKVLVLAALILMAYVVATTWSYLISHPDATREFANFEDTAQEDVANYYFIYAIPMVICVFAACFVKLNVMQKLVSLAVIVVSFVFLVNAQYTLSLLVSAIGVIYQVFKSIKSQVGKLLFLLAMVAVSVFIPDILGYLVQEVPSAQVATRLSEIRDFLTGKGAGGYNINGRLTLYGETLKAFIASPVFGNRSLPFDGHATFLTVLSDTGILGSVPFYSLLCLIVKLVSGITAEHKNQFKVIVLMFVLMGITNPVHSSMPLGFATWFLAPLMIVTIFNKEVTRYEAVES